MAKLLKVLVAYDGSPQSKDALHWAIYASHHSGSLITAVKVSEPLLRESMINEVGVLPDNFAHYEKQRKSDIQLMDDIREFGKTHGIEITTEILSGHPAKAILNYAADHDIGLIITGTKGKGALQQLLLGSVTRSLVSLSHVPVLVVKNCPVVDFTGGSLIMATLRNILVAYDGSASSKKALKWAISVAKPVGAQVNALKVREPVHLMEAYSIAESGSAKRMMAKLEELEKADLALLAEAREMGQKEGIKVSTHITDGNVVEAVLGFAQKHGVDFIVAGAIGHGPLDKLPLGSVATNLISISEVPVLVVKG